MGMSFVSRTAG